MTLVISRSRSSTDESFSESSSRSMEVFGKHLPRSDGGSISGIEVTGCSIRSTSILAPAAVFVRSRTQRSDPFVACRQSSRKARDYALSMNPSRETATANKQTSNGYTMRPFFCVSSMYASARRPRQKNPFVAFAEALVRFIRVFTCEFIRKRRVKHPAVLLGKPF